MKFLRNIFAFLLMPAVFAAGYALVRSLLRFAAVSGNRYITFWIGILSYIVFQVVFYKPMKIYVFGHELSHAIAGVLSGAKIKKFNVNKESGSVVLTKDNIWITLAPYFFPIYAIAIAIIYTCLGWITDIKRFYDYFLFFMGFSIAFHIALTTYILSVQQPDLKVYGMLFSYIMILAVNIVIFALLACLVFRNTINIQDIFLQIYNSIVTGYKFLYHGVLDICLAFQKTK
jgi:hypothetical protein